MNRRGQIELTSDERRRFLEESRTITLSTIDRHGYPHSVAMWYIMDDDACLMTTYAKSQKAVNISRNPKVALLAESGVTYDTLKGVLIRGHAQLIADVDACANVLSRVHQKMMGALPPGIEEALKLQARKRVIIRVSADRISSWDHAKLVGAY
jgi:PPOX class probable F420-dependent enzyme